MTQSEYFTSQFYTWEYRGRGYFLSDMPVQLEPPFIPFFRHGYQPEYIDDGKRHTVVSWVIEKLKGKKTILSNHDIEPLDYELSEVFEQIEEYAIAAIQVRLSKERKITPEKMKALLLMLSYMESPVSFEVFANATEIIIQFVCNDSDREHISTNINAYFPECILIENNTFLENIVKPGIETSVVDFGLKEEFVRPLLTAKNFTIDSLTPLFGILDNFKEDEQGGIQIIFQSTVNNWRESIFHSVTLSDGKSFFEDEPDAPKLALEKIQSPLFAVTIRAFGQATTGEQAKEIVQRISNAVMNATRGSWNELVPLLTDSYDIQERINDVYLRQSHRLGMLLNADELVNILHFPSENIHSAKLIGGHRKTKEVPALAKRKTFELGSNSHNGLTEAVCEDIDARVKHMHIIGATGTGKSTLIANLVLQDIEKGIGIALFDPHGDLIDDVMARIPKDRLTDTVLIDPSDTEFPIGLNILEAHNDLEKEILSSDLVASFRKLSTSWGDQMNAVFGNAIIAMIESGQHSTLHDLRRFLVEKEYRMKFLQSVQDPSILYYWAKEYPLLKTNSIGPILTRMDTFLRPKTIRNMVIQTTGLDFQNLLAENKIILVKLSQGLIGTENSYLLGSLILSKIHQAALARQQSSSRNPFFIYLDEFQNFITPSIKEMLSGVRKYNVGLVLSHQDLQQLQREDGELLNSVLGNTYTRVVFRVGETDAKKLQDGFSSFDFTDLQNLGRGEAVIRIEQPKYDCSLDTKPLSDVSDEEQQLSISAIISHSRKTYAKEKTAIEKILFDTLKTDIPVEDKPVPEKQIIQKEEHPITIEKKTIGEAKEIIPDTHVDTLPEQKEKNSSQHAYLKMLVKKMAESRGYVAVIEKQLADNTGQIDVVISRGDKQIAIEICNTTDAEWEMHNITKCITAGYPIIISLSVNTKQLEKIRKKCVSEIPDFEKANVLFLTPDSLFQYLDSETKQELPQEQIIKGYRVNVSYDTLTQDEMEQKRKSVASVVLNSLRKKK
ncbi:MAG: type IV secretion system DNA-binding domain-containing protein [Ferruginibacter sp.]